MFLSGNLDTFGGVDRDLNLISEATPDIYPDFFKSYSKSYSLFFISRNDQRHRFLSRWDRLESNQVPIRASIPESHVSALPVRRTALKNYLTEIERGLDFHQDPRYFQTRQRLRFCCRKLPHKSQYLFRQLAPGGQLFGSSEY